MTSAGLLRRLLGAGQAGWDASDRHHARFGLGAALFPWPGDQESWSHEVLPSFFLVKRLPIMILPSILLFFCLISPVNVWCNCDIATLHTFPKSCHRPTCWLLAASCGFGRSRLIPWGISFFHGVWWGNISPTRQPVPSTSCLKRWEAGGIVILKRQTLHDTFLCWVYTVVFYWT